MGKDAVVEVLKLWHTHFTGVTFASLSLRPLPGRVKERAHAAHCYEVKYSLVGCYVRVIPGLESFAPVRPQRGLMGLPVADMVWLDGQGRVLRITNRFSQNMLR